VLTIPRTEFSNMGEYIYIQDILDRYQMVYRGSISNFEKTLIARKYKGTLTLSN